MFIFGEHLRSIRKSRHLTQKQLAINIEASERGVQQYELGERRPTYDMLITLADYFDISLDYLVGRSDNPTRYSNTLRFGEDTAIFVFGVHLKKIRESRSLTQKQLALNLGVSESGIQQYELGKRKPAYDKLIALADYFDVSLDYLVGRSDDPTRH